ncbi:MAG: class I SAM-dependent methyltransferase [Firmicutes bacterium]|nr:class I SAM-dependent methyltransferase [Bacillota bacterium]
MAEHYFTVHPESKHDPAQFTAKIRGWEFTFQTDAGVFSRGRLDPGSRLLIETVELTGVTAPLDLGCGYGPVGLAIARELPTRNVYMSDLNQRAVELAAENARLNGINNVVIKQGDGFSPWEELLTGGFKFDLVVTNPPLRAGKQTVLQLFREAHLHLAPDGHLWTVIRTNQGAKSYLRELETIFGSAEVVAIKSGYRVLRAQKSPLTC